ncbi:MAG TPA: carboxypeptidase-like regulatory domain-containing protein [Vicinamibacterales bacterium]|nr:carboxypeptidase-like regulatory domain-containing protein [Vicinamibacterales bacterium]
MRKFIAAVVSIAFVAAMWPVQAGAASGQVVQARGGTVEGIARDANQQPLPKTAVQIRNVATGQLVGTQITGPAGQFVFTGIGPGNYVVELVDNDGKIIGASVPFSVAEGMTATVAVTAAAGGALGAAGGGFGILGLGKAASLTLLAGIGAGITAAIVAANDPASPSK